MDLNIEGRHALLFDDDSNASFVNSRAALVPWNGDESLLIDRYDVRHLLDRIPPRSKKLRFVEDTGGVSKSELDSERYLDLVLDQEKEEADAESETIERSAATGSGSYQAVPFSYGNKGANSSVGELNDSSFCPPFPVPTSLLGSLPPTEKLHQIMARTAIFVSEHGGQSEIVLRVKQGDNPTFGFLMPDNQLHAYFRFLVEHPHLLKGDNNTQQEKKSNGQESQGGALSLLGSLYGTAEDDDFAPKKESKEEGPDNQSNADNSVFPHKSIMEEPSSLSLESKQPNKHTVSAAIKEKSLIPKRNHFVNSASIGKKGDGSTLLHNNMDKPGSQPGKTDVKPPVFEPPSFLKRTMDKIVEFILRNGKEFEAVLVEQDKTAGRFPFLLPSNQYHSYYLKVLNEAVESKLLSKNLSDGSKREPHESLSTESTADELPEGWFYDPHKKEKFKMVIGSKKDSVEQNPKPVRKSGVSADEAAAIVFAATRGRSPANAFQSTSVANSADSETQKLGSVPTVANAAAVAKTVALIASNEADSSEASLTKEQKLKAERLKRAKMFAAMIKSGVKPAAESAHSGGTPNLCMDHSKVGSNHEQGEGSSAAVNDVEALGKETNYTEKRDAVSKKHEEDSDEDDDDKPSRKKHRKEKESIRHRSSRHHRKYEQHHRDSEDDKRQEKRHHRHHRHRKHLSDLEDEERNGSSKHRHRHRKHNLSDDEEDQERSGKHKRKHRSRSEKREELDGEAKEKEKSADVADDGGSGIVSEDKPSGATDIPSDLRAKIRAMLLETM